MVAYEIAMRGADSGVHYAKYEYVIAVAELQSISEAAKKMYISQPALTKILNNLESDLGVKLFNRGVIPVQLTYAGECYIARAAEILLMEKKLRREMEELSDAKRGRISVGTGSSGSALWLPHILPAFHAEFPSVEISVTESNHANLIDKLLKEMIDLVLSSFRIKREVLDSRPLTSARMVLYAPVGHPAIEGEVFDYMENGLDNPLRLEPKRLNGQSFVSYGSDMGMNGTMRRVFDQYGIIPGSILHVQNTIGAYRLAVSGMGMIFSTPYATHYTFPNMVPVVCAIEDQPREIESYVIYKRGRELSSIEKRFIEISQEKLRDHPLLRPLTPEEWRSLKSGQEGASLF
jgi:DNA-binding transcriptional LysR family regulator